MLPHAFVDWWFAPWAYAHRAHAQLPLAADRLGQRDGYRLWCDRTGIAADLPGNFDPAWSDAVCTDGPQLMATARLFAGLMAAREHEQAVLDALPFAERKWCISIAATQPLLRCRQARYGTAESIEVRGLVELARRLKNGFPGLWPRLRLMLPSGEAEQVDRLLDTAVATTSDTSAVRAQRCWRLCRNYAATPSPKQEEK